MELSVNLGLPVSPATDDKKLFDELLPIYAALRNITAALDSYTGVIPPQEEYWGEAGAQIRANGMAKVYVKFYEAADVGHTMSFIDVGGEMQVRKAQYPTYRCHGFVSNKSTAAGAVGEITLLGQFPTFPDNTLTPGSAYQQSATAGVIMPDSGAAYQTIGFALNDTTLFFNPSYR